MSSVVLDASALLALLNGEPGQERVYDALAGHPVISTVNLSEVVAKLADRGMPEGVIREVLEPLGLEVVEFDAADAYEAGLLRPITRNLGLSLGDRACLAVGRLLGVPVLTADTIWSRLNLDGLQVELLR
jgi:PIN domain nuclease of toxin-antitoxin system